MPYKGIIHAKKIATVVSEIFGLESLNTLKNRRKKDFYLARGIFCLYCYNEGIHPIFIKDILGCTRSNVINIMRHYKGYYEIKDKTVTIYYDSLIKKLSNDRK